jgi:hypothetical protein
VPTAPSVLPSLPLGYQKPTTPSFSNNKLEEGFENYTTKFYLSVAPEGAAYRFSHQQKALWVGSVRNWKQATSGTTLSLVRRI